MSHMKALYFDGIELGMRTVEAPSPERGEILVKVLYAGICSTDLEILGGYMDFSGIPGHEFVGIALGGDLEGRRVTGAINVPCGGCATCAKGMGKHCPERTVLGISGRDGAFAEYLVLPAGNLYPVPDPVDDRSAVMAELLAAAGEFVPRVGIGPGIRAAVLGDGRLAAMTALVLRNAAAGPVIFGRDPKKLSVLRAEGFDARETGGTGPDRRSFDLAVDCTGSPGGPGAALGLVRPGGTVVIKSTFRGTAELDTTRIAVDEITVVGSRCGDIGRALELLESGEACVSPFISAVYPLSRWKEAFEKTRKPGTFKVLLEIGR